MPSLLWLIGLVAIICHVGILTPALSFTFSGIYYDPDCSSEDLDHGVLVTGYGTEIGQSINNTYWIVKNRYKKPKILIFKIEKGILLKISVWSHVLKPLSTLLKSQMTLPYLGKHRHTHFMITLRHCLKLAKVLL